MPKNEAFLRAILDDPDDDAVRLVYADWLEENGDPDRAEFIRIQIQLANLPLNDPERKQLTEREWALRSQFWDHWVAELPEPKIWNGWRRGFVEDIFVDNIQGIGPNGYEQSILSSIPLRRLTLIRQQNYRFLAGSPLLTRMRELSIITHADDDSSGHFGDEDLVEILGWRETKHLTFLELEGPELSPKGVRELAKTPFSSLRSFQLGDPAPQFSFDFWELLNANWLSNLETLSIRNYPIPSGWIRRLSTKLNPKRLRSLVFYQVGLTDSDVDELIESELLNSLIDLQLCKNQISLSGVYRLIQVISPNTSLLLDDNPIGEINLKQMLSNSVLPYLSNISYHSDPNIDDDLAIELAGSKNTPHLSWIKLNRTSISSVGAKAILKSPNLTSLYSVELNQNRIASLSACSLSRLFSLEIAHNQIDTKGIVDFIQNSKLPSLFILNLIDNRLDSNAAEVLSHSNHFYFLAYLYLSGNPLGEEGASALALSKGFPKLHSLHLTSCGIGDKAIQTWMNSPLLSQLKRINVKRGNSISEDVFAAFQQRAAEFGCEVY